MSDFQSKPHTKTPDERQFVEEPEVHTTTVGSYLAQRLVEAGASTFFTVPGDYILGLLDSLLKNKGLKMIGCCNELNGGYAADGYCRATGGLGVLVVTYMVGGLSAINAVAGAYSDDLPLLLVSGGPNSNDGHDRHLIHHTIGEIELYQAARCFEPVVAKTFVIRHLKDAAYMIDEAILTALVEKKPVYLEIPVNLNGQKIPMPSPLSFKPPRKVSDPLSLHAAVEDILERLHGSVKPVLIAGVKLRCTESKNQFLNLAEAIGCGVATMPDAKSLFSEDHPLYMGTYWAGLSSPHVINVVENSDLMIFAGAVLNDYTTVGWTSLINVKTSVEIFPYKVLVCGKLYANVTLYDLLVALSNKAPKKEASMKTFLRYSEGDKLKTINTPSDPTLPLTLREVRRQVQGMMTHDTSLVIETGDSWFIGQEMTLPEGARYHFQMQYGSIGWATGATLGVALGVGHSRKVISMIGDGSFQLTVQEVATMIRQRVKCCILIMNNRGYTIEVQIHDGPYNDIKNWAYAELMEVFNAGEGDGLGIKVENGAELSDAIIKADHHNGVTLIEVIIDRDDCTAALLEFGSKVAFANGRL